MSTPPAARAVIVFGFPLAVRATGLLLSAALLVRPAAGPATSPAPTAATPAAGTTAASVEGLKRQGTYGSLMAAVRSAEYGVRPLLGTPGAYVAENGAQAFETRFGPQSVVVAPRPGRHPSVPLRLRLSSWSRGGKQHPAGNGRLVLRGSRVEYRRDSVAEWYQNDERGLEQGFTVSGARRSVFGPRCLDRAPGTRRPSLASGDSPLTLTLAVEGGYRADLQPGGREVDFRAEGGATVRYSGLTASDARGRTLPACMALSGKQLEIRVADAGAVYPVTIDPLLTTETKLTAASGAANDAFGTAVALSGNTALVGASGRNGGRGAAYVFTLTGGSWVQQAELAAADAAANDLFGRSVALDGETALVGAYAKSSNRGAAYVFVGSGSAWSQQQKLTAGDGAASDAFGISVALSGETAVVGAYTKNASTGAAYVFARSGGAWSQQQKLTAADAAANDYFGISVALAGKTALVGAAGRNGLAGAMYVFTQTGSVWSQQQELSAADAAPGDLFGFSVALSGETALAGASGKNTNKGAGYVFTRAGSVWSQQQKLTAADGVANDDFGQSVALSGNIALLGAYNKSSATGAAYLFTRAGSTWAPQQQLVAADAAAGDRFGAAIALSGNRALVGAYSQGGGIGAAYVENLVTGSTELLASDGAEFDDFAISVALSGNTALVGADVENGTPGAAYVFVRSGAAWTQQQKLTASDAVPGDGLGNSVALSGNTALLGALSKNNNTGAAYVFVRSGSVWAQQQKLTASDGGAQSYFGGSVALFGEIALIGNTGPGGSVGAAYVFERSGGVWTEQQKLTASDGAPLDVFGRSVALSEGTALVGASGKNGATGAAYVFTRTGSTWSQQQELTAPDAAAGDGLGYSVGLSGNTGLVGTYGNNGKPGAAYVFVRSGSIWTQQQKLTASDAAVDDQFGYSVGLSGETALVGAHAQNSLSGAAYVFTRSGIAWTQQAKLTASDAAANDHFGISVALSGETALVGAYPKNNITGAAYTFELAPYAPLSLAASKVSSTEADLSWIDISGIETGFEIQRSLGSSGWQTVLTADENAISAVDGPLAPGTTYTYRIRAVNDAGPGDWSDAAVVTTAAGTPSAPSNLQAVAAAPDQVTLSWTDNSLDEESFEIQRQTGTDPWAPVGVVGAGIATTTDSDLTPGRTYHYRVRAGNESGDSDWSNTANVTLATGLPTAPTGLTATALSPTQARVTWNDAAGETSYDLQRSPNNTLWSTIGTVAANVVSATDGTALPNTTYFYRVRAVNSFGGVTSGAVSVTTPGTPSAPTGLILTALSATRVRIDWTDTSTTETSFEVDRSLNRTLWKTVGAVSANVISATDDGAEPATFYWYRVRSVNGYGSSNSASISVTTPDGLPAAPSGLAATAVSSTQINLVWTDNASNETSFEVQWRGNAGATSEPWLPLGMRDANATTAADLGLNPATSYSYRVRAVNGIGASAWSATATAMTLAGGSSGVSLRAGSLKPGRIRLTWTGKGGRSGTFSVERKEGGALGPGRFAAVGGVRASAGKWVDAVVKPGARYTYRLRRESAFSNSASARAPGK